MAQHSVSLSVHSIRPCCGLPQRRCRYSGLSEAFKLFRRACVQCACMHGRIGDQAYWQACALDPAVHTDGRLGAVLTLALGLPPGPRADRGPDRHPAQCLNSHSCLCRPADLCLPATVLASRVSTIMMALHSDSE
jgi:hypothetical protein